MQFTDRHKEQERLRTALSRTDKSVFVVLYGRRRLGKSALIRQVIRDCDIYYMSEMLEQSVQIALFASCMATKFPNFDKVIYPDWETLLTELNNRTSDRFTLCIDEFPYLVKTSPQLPSVLQKLIDSKTLRYHIIICGSSQQMMYDSALCGSSPLYGRADVLMRLQPIGLRYIGEALQTDEVTAIEEYAVWGGVPRYWELREQARDLFDAIERYALTADGELYDEPRHLLMDDMRDIVQAATILAIIGNGVNRMSEIAARANKPATQLSGPLDRLRMLNLIRREVPFGEDEKNSKKSLYKISDPYMDFYYHFVVPNRSLIEIGRTATVKRLVGERFTQYVSMHWEDMCRRAVSGNQIEGVLYNKASRWWGNVSKSKAIEIDVVAESMDGAFLLVGECKWTEDEDADYLCDKLMEKAQMLPMAHNKQIKPVLFLKKRPSKEYKSRVYFPADVIELNE